MEAYQIQIDDFQRIFIGDLNWEFYLELILRSLAVYLILIFSLRLIGQRMASQLSRIEMAAMVTLAAAIGVPLQTSERGLLPAVIIALVVVCVARVISYYSLKNQRFEQITQDSLSILVEDSTLNLQLMKKTRITRERLFAQLRSEGITNLGIIKRVYFEAGGDFSLIKYTSPQPGLCILPVWDEDFIHELEKSEEKFCIECGKKKISDKSNQKEDSCQNCGNTIWTNGVKDQEDQHQ